MIILYTSIIYITTFVDYYESWTNPMSYMRKGEHVMEEMKSLRIKDGYGRNCGYTFESIEKSLPNYIGIIESYILSE